MENNFAALAWAERLLTQHTHRISPAQNVFTKPWSNIWLLQTPAGHFYLKQTAANLAIEPEIIHLLQNISFHVPDVFAANPELHCFLMKDAGVSLRDYLKKQFDPHLLCYAVEVYSALQYETVPFIPQFLGLGVPDWRLQQLPRRYHELLQQEEYLLNDGLTTTELNHLRAETTRLATLCDELATFQIEQTLDHCDFHTNNILVADSKHLTIIDWGEVAITHPFFSYITFLAQASQHHIKNSDQTILEILNTLRKSPLLKNMTAEEFNYAMLLARKIWPVYAALGFYRLLENSNPVEFKQYYTKRPHRLAGYLKTFLESFQST